MEVTLEDAIPPNNPPASPPGFNPYSNGSYAGSTQKILEYWKKVFCFNPYSNGSYAGRSDGKFIHITVC